MGALEPMKNYFKASNTDLQRLKQPYTILNLHISKEITTGLKRWFYYHLNTMLKNIKVGVECQ